MAEVPGNVEWVAELIPGLEGQIDQFIVATDEVDDELVEIFIEELRRLSGDLQQGMEEGDAELIRLSAHSIKGMGGTIGLPEISVLGLTIENAAKSGEFQKAQPLVDALTVWLEQLA